MKTFAELYCAAHGCTRAQCQSRLFWRSLHVMAWPLVPWLGGRLGRYCAPDHELISGVADARTMSEVREAIRDYRTHSDQRRPLRRWLHVRVSTVKLKRLARAYLPDPSGTTAPFATVRPPQTT